MTGPDAPIPIGVYREGSLLAEIQAYEAFLGMPAGTTVSFVVDFMPDKPTWAQFEAGTLRRTTNGGAGSKTAASAWGGGQLGGRRLMLAVPACVQGSSWAVEASGANDARWRALGASLVASGLQNSVLRIGREFNGGWYPWTAGWPGGNTVANYLAGYQHVVSVLRSVPGAAFSFMWNPTIGVVNGLMAADGVEQSYPGSDCVDVIGLDIYDGDWTGIYDQSYVRTAAQQLASFDSNVLNCADGLTAWQELAEEWGKPVGFPEWGLRLWNDGDVYHGGGDDPVFIVEMATWLKGRSAWMHAFWEDTGGGVMDPDDSPRRHVAVPRSRAAFLAEFGWS